MRVALFGNSTSARQGGSLVYLSALAAALVERHEVDCYSPNGLGATELSRVLPEQGGRPAFRPEPRRSEAWVWGELKAAFSDRAYDLVVLQSSRVPRLSLCARAYLLCEFPFQKSVPWDDRARLSSYRGVIANSSYTARWIERLWGRRAEVLHPAVSPVEPGPKRPYILGVGRFLEGGRSKRQRELVSIFRELCSSGLKDWELHLAGFVQDKAYAALVSEEAKGLPVKFHWDAGRPELEELYSVSSVFWHAVGAGVDPEERPEGMEHFGISTVEAMSAGCVPVVINRGGQPEIVGPGQGVLWESLEECAEATSRLAADAARLNSLSRACALRARDFAFPAFSRRAREIFS
ncbi:MAG: glycosyltransferase family 4 protein [Elusimicrobia bacterium]|nr:glycosyltransferase family 4 protein [Elusimicrobiota bacterium]